MGVTLIFREEVKLPGGGVRVKLFEIRVSFCTPPTPSLERFDTLQTRSLAPDLHVALVCLQCTNLVRAILGAR